MTGIGLHLATQHLNAEVVVVGMQTLMSDIMVDGAFSAQLSNGFTQLTAPMAAMADIQVDGAASLSMHSGTDALERLL